MPTPQQPHSTATKPRGTWYVVNGGARENQNSFRLGEKVFFPTRIAKPKAAKKQSHCNKRFGTGDFY